MTNPMPELILLPDPPAVARRATEAFVEHARRAIAERNTFTVALSGGSTPKAMFDLLASDEFRSKVDWPRVEIFFVDERCVPPTSNESNYRMTRERLLWKVPVQVQNVWRMRGEISPEPAAILYGRDLKNRFQKGAPDLILLGMGDDGHTASLFPNTPALDETDHRCVPNHVPYDYIPAGTNWRVTMSAPFINRSKHVMFMVTGASKSARVLEVLTGPRDVQRLPAQLIAPTDGRLSWLLDSAAGMALAISSLGKTITRG